MPSAIRLHRVLTADPQKVYRAFIAPDAMASWQEGLDKLAWPVGPGINQ